MISIASAVLADKTDTNVCLIQSTINKIPRIWSKSILMDNEECVYRAKWIAEAVAENVWSVKYLRNLERKIVIGDAAGHFCEDMAKRKKFRSLGVTRQKIGMLIDMPKNETKIIYESIDFASIVLINISIGEFIVEEKASIHFEGYCQICSNHSPLWDRIRRRTCQF